MTPTNNTEHARLRSQIGTVADVMAELGVPIESIDHLAEDLIEAGAIELNGDVRGQLHTLLWDGKLSGLRGDREPLLWLHVVSRLLRHEPVFPGLVELFEPDSETIEQLPAARLATLLRDQRQVDVTDAFVSYAAMLRASGERFAETLELARLLWAAGLVEPRGLIRINELFDLATSQRIRPYSAHDGRADHAKNDPGHPAFWIAVAPAAAIHALAPVLDAAGDEELATLALGAKECVLVSFSMTGISGSPPPAVEVTRFAMHEVDDRIGPDPRQANQALRRAWLRLWFESFGRSEFEEREGFTDRLLAAADKELGSLRPVLEKADELAFVERSPALNPAVSCVFDFATLWDGFRPLLLAMRSLTVPCVSRDLRWWRTGEQESPPQPWCQIPESLASSFQTYARREQEHDQELSSLRDSFARFCLDRLKTSKKTGGPAERDAAWRLGFIKAAVALKINPGGKGHHVLNHAREHDPDQEVRDVAKEAYTKLRHMPTLPAGTSPRRTVLLAFWHLRWAHLASLGVPIDFLGARETHYNELRRTTQAEDMETNVFDF